MKPDLKLITQSKIESYMENIFVIFFELQPSATNGGMI